MVDYKLLSLYNTIINIGEITGEYIDKLKLYEEYNEYHKSNIADIANHNYNTRSECVDFFFSPPEVDSFIYLTILTTILLTLK